jgi:hypothetical protein
MPMLGVHKLINKDAPMGMLKWMARKGAVGGAARWAAKGYKAISKQDPNIEVTDLYRTLIKSRFAVMPNPEHEAFLMGISSQIKGLRGLVVSVLTIETGFTENTPDNQQMFMEIIDEELRNHGIPQNVIQDS